MPPNQSPVRRLRKKTSVAEDDVVDTSVMASVEGPSSAEGNAIEYAVLAENGLAEASPAPPPVPTPVASDAEEVGEPAAATAGEPVGPMVPSLCFCAVRESSRNICKHW